MSFIKRAQEAAAAGRRGGAARPQDAAGSASRTAHDPATPGAARQAGAREAVGMARRGMTTVVEKIDPGTLAELIIKATALQEMTNGRCARRARRTGSPRSRSPPRSRRRVSFAISRVDDEPEERCRATSCHRASWSSRSPIPATSCWRSTGRRSMRRPSRPRRRGRTGRDAAELDLAQPLASAARPRSRSRAAPRPPRSGGSSARRSRAP